MSECDVCEFHSHLLTHERVTSCEMVTEPARRVVTIVLSLVSWRSQTARPAVRAAVVEADSVAVSVPAAPDTIEQEKVASAVAASVVVRIWAA